MRAIFGAIFILAGVCGAAFAQDAAAAEGEALIEGSVINRVSGTPVKRAHVMFARVGAAADAEGFSSTYADTDAGGRFAAHLPPGRYRIWVERQGFSRLDYEAAPNGGAGKAIALAPGQELRELTFRIAPLNAIAGHVLDEDGDPVQGAGVQVLKFSYATGQRTLVPVGGTSSNDRGEYRAFGLPPGRYYLLVTQPGAPLSTPLRRDALVADAQDFFAPLYYPGVLDLNEATPVVLTEGADAQDVDIRLQRIRVTTLRGRLLSPVENFAASQLRVFLAPREGDSASFINRSSAAVDRASGRFEFHNVAPGSYVLAAAQLYSGGTWSGRAAVEVSNSGAHPEEIPVALSGGGEISGTLETENGTMEMPAQIRVELAENEGLGLGPPRSARVEASGAFRLTGVTPGVWAVSAAPLPKGAWIKSVFFNGRETPAGTVELTGSSAAAMRIVLAPGAQLSGTVTRGGQPTRATVLLVPNAADLRARAIDYANAASDDQGNFVFNGVRPGSYKLLAFEDIEPNAWLDPEFLKSVESLGQDVTLSEGENPKQQATAVVLDANQPAP